MEDAELRVCSPPGQIQPVYGIPTHVFSPWCAGRANQSSCSCGSSNLRVNLAHLATELSYVHLLFLTLILMALRRQGGKTETDVPDTMRGEKMIPN